MWLVPDLLVVIKPARDVPAAMQHTHNVDVRAAIDMEDQIRQAPQVPRSQSGQLQLVGSAH